MNNLFRSMVGGLLGGIVGTFVAKDLIPAFWVLGLLVGALCGIVAFGPISFCRGIKQAFLEKLCNNKWMDSRFWPAVRQGAIFATFISFLVMALVIATVFVDWKSEGVSVARDTAFWGYLIVTTVYLGTMFTVTTQNLINKKVPQYDGWDDQTKRTRLFLICTMNPVTLFFAGLLMWLALIGAMVILVVGEVWAKTPDFFCRVAVCIDINARLTAMTGATLGTLVGYLAGSVILGGLIGAVSAGILWLLAHAGVQKFSLA